MRKSANGFTVAESAIVLGVVSLVLGAVWIAVGTVTNASQVAETAQQVGEVSQDIRSYYMNAPGIPMTACNADITSTLITNKIFPTQMVSCRDSPTNCKVSSSSSKATTANTFSVRGHAATCPSTSGDRFRVVLSGLSKKACENLLFSGVNYQDTAMGIKRICASSGTGCSQGTGWNNITCGTTGTSAGVCGIGTTPAAITLAQAESYFCTGTSNEVGWEYSLR